MKIETNLDKIGDVITIYRNEYNELLSTNNQTGVIGSVSLSMLRNIDLVEIIEVVK